MSPSPRRVVLLGKGTLSVRAAAWFVDAAGWTLDCVVPVVPEPDWTDSLSEFARERRVPLVATGDFRDVPDAIRIDLAMSISYDRVVDREFIRRCGRILNLHHGPLPRYRGVRPINWALKNEERTHGVTLHEITPEIDAGPIVAQATYSLYPEFDEVEDVYKRSLEFGWVLFKETMPLLDEIKPRPQEPSQATYYSLRDAARLGNRARHTRASSVGAAQS